MASKFIIKDRNGVEISNWTSSQELFSHKDTIEAAVARWDEIITSIPGDYQIEIQIDGDENTLASSTLGAAGITYYNVIHQDPSLQHSISATNITRAELAQHVSNEDGVMLIPESIMDIFDPVPDGNVFQNLRQGHASGRLSSNNLYIPSKGEITLNTNLLDGLANTMYDNDINDTNAAVSELYNVLVHEIGHILGILDTSYTLLKADHGEMSGWDRYVNNTDPDSNENGPWHYRIHGGNNATDSGNTYNVPFGGSAAVREYNNLYNIQLASWRGL